MKNNLRSFISVLNSIKGATKNLSRYCSFKGTVSGYGYFFEGLNILISTFCVCADCFQGLSKAFHYAIQLLTFYLLLWSYLLILKMITETLLRISFSVIGSKKLARTLCLIFHSSKKQKIVHFQRMTESTN